MPTRVVTLVAPAAVDIERGLRLPAGRYKAIEERDELRSLAGVNRNPPAYLIDLKPEEIVAFGGNVDHPELISEQYDVTEQVRAGTLKLA
jgi:hypothetical protein